MKCVYFKKLKDAKLCIDDNGKMILEADFVDFGTEQDHKRINEKIQKMKEQENKA